MSEDARLFEAFKRQVLEAGDEGGDEPINEDEVVKAELLRQHHEDRFGTPDPSDSMSDDELWEAMPKPWERNG